nr:lantibiotic dehydratase C-terminal domain-containing protein [Streptomyces mexicanus]
MEPVSEWAAAFRSTGQELRQCVQAGTLDRGLRQVLSYHVIFHWNRLVFRPLGRGRGAGRWP